MRVGRRRDVIFTPLNLFLNELFLIFFMVLFQITSLKLSLENS